jgi:hypothetical protein
VARPLSARDLCASHSFLSSSESLNAVPFVVASHATPGPNTGSFVASECRADEIRCCLLPPSGTSDQHNVSSCCPTDKDLCSSFTAPRSRTSRGPARSCSLLRHHICSKKSARVPKPLRRSKQTFFRVWLRIRRIWRQLRPLRCQDPLCMTAHSALR